MTVIAAVRVVKATGVGANKLLVIRAFTLFVKVRFVAIYGDNFSLFRNNFQAIVSRRFFNVRFLRPYIKV